VSQVPRVRIERTGCDHFRRAIRRLQVLVSDRFTDDLAAS